PRLSLPLSLFPPRRSSDLSAFFLFVALSSLGLPILNGFVGEYLILLGTYAANWRWAAWAASGVILSACYLLWAYQRVFFGEVTQDRKSTRLNSSHQIISYA